jgi:hypothetical protein
MISGVRTAAPPFSPLEQKACLRVLRLDGIHQKLNALFAGLHSAKTIL